MIIKKGENHFTFDDDTSEDFNVFYECEDKNLDNVINDIINNSVFITDGGKEKILFKQVKNNEIICSVIKNIPRMLSEMNIISDDNKKITFKNLFKKQLKKIKINNFDFHPYNPMKTINFNESTFNTFKGFVNKYDENFKVDENLIKPILDHINILSNYENNSKEYILNYLSRLIKIPEKKSGICLVFMSNQGAGKTGFFEWFNNSIIGKEWTLTISNNENIFKNFNAELNNKILTILDEAQLEGSYKKKSDQLKSLITQNFIRIEYKGMDPLVMNDRNNYIILTNNDFPVKIEQSDRRFAVFNMSNDMCGNTEYFNKLNDAFDNNDVKKHFFHYLLYRNIDNFHPERDIPTTQAKTELKKESAPSPVRFAIDLIQNGIIKNNYNIDDILSGNALSNDTKMKTSELYEHYKTFMNQKCPGERVYVENGFVLQIKKLLNIKTSKYNGENKTNINNAILKDSICNYFKIKTLNDLNIQEFEYDSAYEDNENDNIKIDENNNDNHICYECKGKYVYCNPTGSLVNCSKCIKNDSEINEIQCIVKNCYKNRNSIGKKVLKYCIKHMYDN